MKTSKKFASAFIVFQIALLASPNSQARTQMSIVEKYARAGEKDVWVGIPEGEVPSSLLGSVTVANPSHAHRAPYTSVFLQNERMVVCVEECDRAQPVGESTGGNDYKLQAAVDTPIGAQQALKAANVYYWANRLFDELATLGYQPKTRLIVRVDRKVNEPSTGVSMHNNAFFNKADWTLSFLSINQPWLAKLLGNGGARITPAYDPTVAMHETMHSVFQSVIGSVLNPEIYGLHEAFADYFALDVINDGRLGVVFGGGQTLRSNDKILKYKVGMEAHDLGNVVSSALWKIRSIIGDVKLARTIAYKTVVELGSNPYISSADVATLHMKVAREHRLTAKQTSEIAAAWTETGLTPKKIEIDTSLLLKAQPTNGYFQLKTTTEAPDWAVEQLAMPKQKSVTIGLISKIDGPKDSNTVWYKINIEKGTESFPLWILHDRITRSFLAAYDLSRNQVMPVDKDFYEKLEVAREELQGLFDWTTRADAKYVDILQGRGALAQLLQPSKIERSEVILEINGKSVKATRTHAKLERKLWGFLAELLLQQIDPVTAASLTNAEAVTTYSVAESDLPTLKSIEVEPGKRLVGLELQLKSGMRASSFITLLDPRHPVMEVKK